MTDHEPTTAEERERWKKSLSQVPGNGLFAAKGCLERLIADVERLEADRNYALAECKRLAKLLMQHAREAEAAVYPDPATPEQTP